MYARTYEPSLPLFFVLRDTPEDERLARLRFHITKADYFPFLATILGFAKESLTENGATATDVGKKQIEFLSDTQKDLIHLQQNYQITPKETPTSFTKEKVIHWKS